MAARPEGGPFQPEDRWPGLGASKKTWNGMRARLDVLEARGIVIPANLPGAGKAPVDDLLDAAAAAWTADRIRRGVAESFPPGLQGPGEVGIWY